jgi:hypothetical protein
MPLPARVYPLLIAWLQAMGVAPHEGARAALAALVAALLVCQSLRSAELMRTLASPEPVPARQRYKRLARHWERPWLTSAGLTPGLVRAAAALVAPDPPGSLLAGVTHLALDSVRLGRWEVFVLGVVWHGRALPVGWAVLPYPLPKGAFTPAVCDLVARVGAAWPAERPARLSADRAFPSYALFAALRAAGWGWQLRLQARHYVTVGGACQKARALLAGASASGWSAYAGAYGGGGRPPVRPVGAGDARPVLGRPRRRPARGAGGGAGGRPRVDHQRPPERLGARPAGLRRPQRAPGRLARRGPGRGRSAPRRGPAAARQTHPLPRPAPLHHAQEGRLTPRPSHLSSKSCPLLWDKPLDYGLQKTRLLPGVGDGSSIENDLEIAGPLGPAPESIERL